MSEEPGSPGAGSFAASAAGASAVALGVLGLSFTRITSPDLGFLIATGRAIRTLGAIPATNVLSYTEPDHPWLLHEWIPSLVFDLAWRCGGPTAVLALKMALVVITWSLVHATARKLGASPVAAALATLLGAGASAFRFTERPQLFSNLVLAAVALLLASARAETGPRSTRFLLAAGATAAVGAQVHAGALTAFLLMGASALGIALEPLRSRWAGGAPAAPGARSAGKLLAVTVGAFAAAALVMALYHPRGMRPLLVPFDLGLDATLREHVVEYRSPLRFPIFDQRFYWLLVALALLPGAALRSTRGLGLPALLPVVVFLGLSLRHVRAVDAFAIVAAPVIATSFEALLTARPGVTRAAWVAVAVAAVGLPIDHWRAFPWGPGLIDAVWPSSLLRFIDDERLTGPAFVSDGWAGPFLGEKYPAERAFFDPRFEAYSPTFVQDVYQRVRDGGPDWEAELDRYGVELILLKLTSTERRARGDNLAQQLVASPRWALVGFGDYGEVFVRRDGKNDRAARALAIPGVDPDRDQFVDAPARSAKALMRAVERGNADNHVFVLAAIAVASAGHRDVALRLLDGADTQRPGDPRVARARDAIDATTP